MTYVTVADLRAAAFGIDVPVGDDADAALQRLIDKAEARVIASIPSIPARVAAGTLPVDLVAGVIEDMVLRVVTNPRGIRSVSIDDYSETIDSAQSTGGLYLSAGERALLAGASSSRGKFGSIRINSPMWWLRNEAPGVDY